MKKQYHITVLGQELSVLSDSGDDHVAKVVQCVKEKIEEIQLTSGSVSTVSVAILAALNIADEYLMVTGTNEHFRHQLESRAEDLISLIDELR